MAAVDGTQKEELTADIKQAPGYDTSSQKKLKLTEELLTRIHFYLKENEQKKKIDIFVALKEEGFVIDYTTIRNTIR